uniref:Uncharacterized protein n=1 Tax=mine drainage metagenome TaxID=410659 RepID=E6QN56_9ZZZZ
MKAFDGDQAAGFRGRFKQRGAKLFEACVVLALDGTDGGHGFRPGFALGRLYSLQPRLSAEGFLRAIWTR